VTSPSNGDISFILFVVTVVQNYNFTNAFVLLKVYSLTIMIINPDKLLTFRTNILPTDPFFLIIHRNPLQK